MDFHCSPEDITATNGCTKWSFCCYPDPEYCDGYVQYTRDGFPIAMCCTSDLEWDDSHKRCEYPPANSECNKKKHKLNLKQNNTVPAN